MELTELVEDLMAYVPLPPSGARVQVPQACLNFQPGNVLAFANVSAVRASAHSLQDLCVEASTFFARQGRRDFCWFLGPSTTPAGAAELLVSAGTTTVMDDNCAAMVLDHEPPRVDAVEIRRVNTPELLLSCRKVVTAVELGGVLSADQETELQATNDAAWQDYSSYAGQRQNFLAYAAGEPVSAAGLLLTDRGVAVLSGGATLPAARGRGHYRALVHARWLAAQQRNAGPLAVQASHMSAPVLARIGFRRLADLMILRGSTTLMNA